MTETIAAISSGNGNAGIGIVRLSGPTAVQIADRVFCAKDRRTLANASSHTIHYGHIVRNGEVLDEVLVSVMRAPRTYTREDVVELNCHGGTQILMQVLEALIDAGARLARPGEFTERAFLSGRIDLSQAEAVMDLISSGNRMAARSALAHLSGALRGQVEALRSEILFQTARVEAALDDPEHFDVDGIRPEIRQTLEKALREVRRLLSRASEGRLVRDGVNTVILGRPNVGKSTLLNLIAGEDRAIVTEIPGTTRDILEEQVCLGGVPLNLQDTAGLRESGDRVERIGVERAREAAAEAALILYVLDSSQPLFTEDAENMETLNKERVILIRNKCDLAPALSREDAQTLLPDAPVVDMAATDGRGLEKLKEILRERFFSGAIDRGDVLITNLRHKEALQETEDNLSSAVESLRAGMPEDLLAADLLGAYAALGRIVGEGVDDDLVNEIFSRFCLGK